MKNSFSILLAAMALIIAGTASAAIQTNNMNVSMDVHTPTSCTVSAGNTLDFGTYVTNSAYGNPWYSTSIDIVCTAGRSYSAYPDYGLNPVGPYRYMSDGAGHSLYYQLWQDLLGTDWSSSSKMYGSGTGSTQTFTVYGYLMAGQLPINGTADGLYQDTVTMVVEYTP